MTSVFTLIIETDRSEQTVWTQIRLHRMQHLVRVYTVCHWSSNSFFFWHWYEYIWNEFSPSLEQEAHGSWVAHLSDIATADMQMLCNIFPILSSQLMKTSSFNQFLILKKNIIWHDSQWSVIIWTNCQSHFNSRINVKFGGKWLSGFRRITILYM